MLGRIITFIIICGFLYYLSFSTQYNFGSFTEFSYANIGEGFERQKVGAGAAFSLEISIMYLVFILYFIFLNRRPIGVVLENKVSPIRRIGAFLIDSLVIIPCITIFAILTLLSVEAIQTGNFEWSFVRDVRSSTDNYYEIITMPGLFFFFVYYFYKHLKSQIPTIGQYIFRYKVSPTKLLYTFDYIGFISRAAMAMVFWPITLYKAIMHDEAWWDRNTNFKAEIITTSNRLFRFPCK